MDCVINLIRKCILLYSKLTCWCCYLLVLMMRHNRLISMIACGINNHSTWIKWSWSIGSLEQLPLSVSIRIWIAYRPYFRSQISVTWVGDRWIAKYGCSCNMKFFKVMSTLWTLVEPYGVFCFSIVFKREKIDLIITGLQGLNIFIGSESSDAAVFLLWMSHQRESRFFFIKRKYILTK